MTHSIVKYPVWGRGARSYTEMAQRDTEEELSSSVSLCVISV